jgi:uncharacterized protein YecT (DUF1311 family)
MKLRSLLVSTLLAFSAINSSVSFGQTPELKAFYANQAEIRERGSNALKAEQARSKADLCKQAEGGGNAAIGACLVKEEKATKQNYLAYVRAVGALLRLQVPGASNTKAPSKATHLPFDSAEEAWRTYRDNNCTSAAAQFEGGDQAQIAYPDCWLRLTWNHMDELNSLYSDLWH